MQKLYRSPHAGMTATVNVVPQDVLNCPRRCFGELCGTAGSACRNVWGVVGCGDVGFGAS